MFNDYFGHLALEITNACNLRCRMCSIWRETPPAQLPEKEIAGVIEKLNHRYAELGKRYKPLVTLTGGEPFLHPRFDQIYRTVQRYREMGSVGKIYIITNGFFTKETLRFLRDNDSECLRIDFSMDGMEKNHNDQRGDPSSFSKMVDTIEAIRGEFPSIPVSVKFTVNKKNRGDLSKVYDFCRERGLGIRFLVMTSPWNGYFNRLSEGEGKQELRIGKNERKIIAKELAGIYKDMRERKVEGMVVGKGSHIISLIKNLSSNHVTECTSPAKELFINSHGDVYPCIYKKPITNIGEEGWEKKVLGSYHKRLMEEGFRRDCPMKEQHCNFLKVTKTALL